MIEGEVYNCLEVLMFVVGTEEGREDKEKFYFLNLLMTPVLPVLTKSLHQRHYPFFIITNRLIDDDEQILIYHLLSKFLS